jgi:hypothetical protein
MTWTITPGEEGFMISQTKGNLSEPWGIILAQDKALKLIEWLEWGETVDSQGMTVAPKPPVPLVKRRRK